MVSCKKPLLLDVSKTVKHGEIDRNREPLCAEFSLGVETLQGLTNRAEDTFCMKVRTETPRRLSKWRKHKRKLVISSHLPFFVQCWQCCFAGRPLKIRTCFGRTWPDKHLRCRRTFLENRKWFMLTRTSWNILKLLKATNYGIADIQRFGFSARTAYHLGCDWLGSTAYFSLNS